jgi:ADP-heptose:LPS heptosyltransferase
MKNILVINLTRMGDLIQSTPLISGLREKYPSAKITMLVTSDFSDFVPFVPNIDDSRVLDLRQFKNRPPSHGFSWVEIYKYLKGFMDQMKAENFDMIVNLSHSRFSALMVRYLAVKDVCGFNCNAKGELVIHHSWMQYFATEPFNRRFNAFNLVEIFARSGDVDTAGRKIQLDESSITKTNASSEILRDLQLKEGQLLIGIQAGSSLAGRRWPWQSFAELAERLIDCLDAKIVLSGVTGESPLAEKIIGKISHKDDVLDLTGKTSLTQLAGVLKQCNYLVGNDTGTLHFASALGTPVVGLYFAHAHAFETGPYYPGNLIIQPRISCAPCSYGVNCNHVVCVDHVPADLVAQMLEHHAKLGIWQAPNHPAVSEIDILETNVGIDDRLWLKPLVRHALTMEDLFRSAYEQLWLQMLPIREESYVCSDTLAENLASNFDCRGVDRVLLEVREKIKALKKLVQYAESGQHLTTRLMECLRMVRTSGHQLQGLGNEIESLDAKINTAGLTNPEVKPITDIFIRRKENLQDDDLLRMTTQTRKYYECLQEESLKLTEIIETAVQRFSLLPVNGFQDETPSIKAAVPLR